MIVVDYNLELDALFSRWQNLVPDTKFVCDGLMRTIPNVDEEWFRAERRIAILMKDKSDGTGDDVRNWLLDNENPNNQKNRILGNKLFLNIANLLYGLVHDEFDFSKINGNPKVRECLLTTPFAYIECKKQAGGARLSNDVLKQFLSGEHGEFLRTELSILHPNIYICTGAPINDFVRSFFSKEEMYIQSNNLAFHQPTNTLIILGYHPSVRKSPIDFYWGFMDHYQKFLQTQYGQKFIESVRSL